MLLTGCGKKLDEDHIACKNAYSLIDDGAILVDVRSADEYKEKHLDKAINIPLDYLEGTIKVKTKSLDDKIIVYCRSGNRSSEAMKILKDLGYKNIYDLGAMNNC